MRIGVIVRAGSMWVGLHYSKANRRYCINIVPCVTIWIVRKGGVVPCKSKM